MGSVVYLDIEASLEGVIKEVGLVYDAYTLKTSSIEQIKEFLTAHSPTYIAGHNIVHFDKVLLDQTSLKSELEKYTIIDTLPASFLLFNEKTFHNLPKKYKNEDAFFNDLMNWSIIIWYFIGFYPLAQLQYMYYNMYTYYN